MRNTKAYACLAVTVMLMTSGCASMKINRETLNDNVQGYHQLIRWQEVSGAVAFVSEPMQATYLDKVTGLNRVKIIDYRIKSVDFSKEQKKATVIVEYDYHLKSGVTIKTIVDTQIWEYLDTAEPVGWRLTTYPPAFP